MKIFRNLFRPKSLGDGLNRVKAKFNVVGENMALKYGERLYKTNGENLVTINTDVFTLNIQKIISPLNMVKDYIGKIAGVNRFYGACAKKSNGKVLQYTSTVVETFARKRGHKQLLRNIPVNNADIEQFYTQGKRYVPKEELEQNVVSKVQTAREKLFSNEKKVPSYHRM